MFSKTIFIVACLVTRSATSTATASHYEKPPCQNDDEKAVEIMGIDGMFCSPSCKDTACPSDVPDGVTAIPTCALQSPTGEKYCAILCSPSDDGDNNSIASDGSMEGGECGPMMCQPIPQAQGMGICVYTTQDQDYTWEDSRSVMTEATITLEE
ncbi:hypothetical protein IV203_021637 [Nitzschia inconspicua]|uniref:Uncharacterized protein n=1 Tax=Nitzschia inconspicua TaxID=303405 RepID=A0A9K3KIC5_9STRA|nr:hypothetical protein IV203_021637 [Nitzschia inconspicua]